jgi:serine phosphatase RsbU (regulator of sigma subunit)/CHASE3 domain sensor protein
MLDVHPSRSRRVAISFAVLIALIVAVAATGIWAVNTVNGDANHRYLEVLIPLRKSARDLTLQMVNEETGVRGYLITTDPNSLQPYTAARPVQQADLAQLRSVVTDVPQVGPLVARATREVAALDRYFASEIALVRQGPHGVVAARGRVEAGKAQFDAFRATSTAILRRADAYTVHAKRLQNNDARYATAVIVVLAGGSLVLSVVLAVRTVRRNRRLIAGIESARDHEHEIASVLQESLLPARLPVVPGLELASRFVPAGQGVEVGGDFYDVFDAGGRWYLVVGDVCGKGPGAARLTALCRNAVRTSALSDRSRSLPTVLRELNRVILHADRDPLQYCTIAIAAVRPDGEGGVSAEIASAGHPPVLLRRGGELEAIERLGVPVGIDPAADYASVERTLGTGDLLLLYTDGVTDTHRADETFGESRVADAVRAGGGPGDVLERVEHDIAAFADRGIGDDVAMLAAQVSGRGSA